MRWAAFKLLSASTPPCVFGLNFSQHWTKWPTMLHFPYFFLQLCIAKRAVVSDSKPYNGSRIFQSWIHTAKLVQLLFRAWSHEFSFDRKLMSSLLLQIQRQTETFFSGLLFGSLHSRFQTALVRSFNIKKWYTKLFVCPLKSKIAAGLISGFQKSCTVCLSSCLGEKVRGSVLFYHEGLCTPIQRLWQG